MRRTFFAFFLTFTLLVPTLVLGQTVRITPAERAMANAITASQLSNYLHFIASDAMAGRDTPSQGLDVTAEFLKMKLDRWKFKPAGDNGTFFQRMALRREVPDLAATSVRIGGEQFTYGSDLARAAGSGNISAPIVYVGNGWKIKSKGLDPYANLDVRGKILAVYAEGQIGGRNFIPLPEGVTQAELPASSRGTDWDDANSYARANGAAGLLLLPSQYIQANWTSITQNFGRSRLVVDKLAPAPASATPAPASFSIFFASPKLANAIFRGEAGDPLAGYSQSFAVGSGKNLEASFQSKTETVWTQNVVALWEGSDPVLKAEMVAIGAHYDHVGINPNVPGDDKIFNGADDDGSGTVAVLAIAEALAMAKTRPKRSVLLVWHAGEEKGLWGAEYFNKFPTVDISKVVAQLNIDMIGRSKKPGDTNPRNKDLTDANSVYVIGSEMMSSTLGAITRQTNDAFLKLNYDYRYDDPKDTNRFFFRSDHYHYAKNGIPIVFWFTGVHEDYHGPADHPDKIDYEKMEKITRTIFLTMLKLSDLRKRPAVDKQLPPELTTR